LRRTTTIKGPSRYPRRNLSDNNKYVHAAVCFCDIPLPDLDLHIAKYGPFGLSFKKSFLVAHGASPIFYVERNAASGVTRAQLIPPNSEPMKDEPLDYTARSIPLGELFDYAEQGYDDLINPLVWDLKMSNINNDRTFADSKREEKKQLQLQRFYGWPDAWSEFLRNHVFPFLKFFDSSLPDNDPDNYYFEREWRLIGVLHFDLADVERVLLPRAFGERFRREFPGYYGQLHFTD
jgi:hypothetical protein